MFAYTNGLSLGLLHNYYETDVCLSTINSDLILTTFLLVLKQCMCILVMTRAVRFFRFASDVDLVRCDVCLYTQVENR